MHPIDINRALGHGRFERVDRPGGIALARDRLTRRQALLPNGVSDPLSILRTAMGPAALAVATGSVGERPSAPGDRFFWQFPARTEADAHDRHCALASSAARQSGATIDVYLGLPWATWIDMQRLETADLRVEREISMQRARLQGLHRALDACGIRLRVHTVCQHVYWERLLATWRDIGITDLWLSHAASASDTVSAELTLHPWSLWAVNVEDPERRDGLAPTGDPAERPVLASFVGAYAQHYASDTRLRLLSLADNPGFVIGLTGQWHFEDIVYRHQIHGEPVATDPQADARTRRYNELLSASRFSLCPAGAGANTLRLWESLAAGAVPVLCGPQPALPIGGTLKPVDWDAIVLRAADDQIADLPYRLASIPLDEVRERQRRGQAAYQAVLRQRCFE